MGEFKPFDEEYNFDKTVLTEDFPTYLLPSVQQWVFNTLYKHGLLVKSNVVIAGETRPLSNDFIMPFNRAMRTNYKNDTIVFINLISTNKVKLRNALTYILQQVADYSDATALETILSEGSSAYTVSIIGTSPVAGIKKSNGEPMFQSFDFKLVYRVAPIVKEQAKQVLQSEQLLADAWDLYYGIDPDDEKVITKCQDALSGAIRDKYFPSDTRPQLGKLLKDLKASKKIHLPAETMYDRNTFIDLMDKFSEKRNNHTKGNSTQPTHEEAGFVLHYTIMLFQLFRIST